MNAADRRRARQKKRAERRAIAAEKRAPLLMRLMLAGEPEWRIEHARHTCPQALLRRVENVEARWVAQQKGAA